MMKTRSLIIAALASSSCFADDLALQIGAIAHPSIDNAVLRIEYRKPILIEKLHELSPQLSAHWQINGNLWHTDETHFAVGTGLVAQYQFNANWAVELGWGGVALDDRYLNQQHDMGSQLHFESTLGLRYQLNSQSALRLNVYHWSNANLAEINPGCEIVLLAYQFSY